MLLSEKVALSYSSSSTSSRPSSPPPNLVPTSRRAAIAQYCAAKRRWLVVAGLYVLVAVAWWTCGGLAGLFAREAGEGRGVGRWFWLAGRERIVYNALGEAFTLPSSTLSPSTASSALASAPSGGSTSLGPAADAVFHLYPAGDRPSPALYLSTLETFLRDHLPPAYSNEADPSALIHALRSFFSAPLAGAVRPPPAIPHTVWHTAPADEAFKRKKDTLRSWTERNDGWTVVRHNDSQADAWVRRRFTLDSNDGGAHGVVRAWERLAEPAVLRSDFWRYLVLAVEGGVYADTDVQCLQAVERWGDDVSWKGERPEGYAAPSLVVGVEADVGNRHDWHSWWPRPLQISQWTMASARGHPVLLDTVRRIVESALLPDDEQPKSVMEKTGPGPFTDAVLSYLAVQYRKPWGTLRGLDSDGYRFRASVDAPALVSSGSRRDRRPKERWGDVKVLSITGFSPGVGHMGAHDRNHPAAMAFHAFAGSWRKQPGADA
ncbi:glycosyltransferase family 32 protein [Rhodotorula paludigena]|uniref:glycosyltransferase family 32 protein n=1 Tax=Rhodotorula paludigena TaxID=86838 RepID=UPI00317D34C9